MGRCIRPWIVPASDLSTLADNPHMFHRKLAGQPKRDHCCCAFVLLAATAAAAQDKLSGETEPGGKETQASSDQASPRRSEREQAIFELVDRKALSDQIIILGAQENSFAVRFERGRGAAPRGSLLFVPSRGAFVGTDAKTDAFFREFPMNGWSVLAVQPPLPERVAELDEYEALLESGTSRIRDAIRFLMEQESAPIVVIGDSDGATQIRQLLEDGVPRAVAAFAAIGKWRGEVDGLPTLELIGASDRAALASSRRREKEAARQALKHHRLIVLGGADGHYLGFEDEIARRTRGWIDRLSADAVLPRAP
jgi:hypothetical protein